MKKYIAILIIIYILSAFGSWYDIRQSYITEWTNLNPTGGDLVVILSPILNTAYCIYTISKLLPDVDVNVFFFLDKR